MFKLTVSNQTKLTNKLSKIANIDLSGALTKAAILVENDAKINCPVDTGILRNSITHEVEGSVAVVGTNTEYAPYVEIGTGIFSSEGTGRQERWCYKSADGQWHSTIGQHPQPFLQPALDSNKKIIDRLIKDEVKKELDKIAGL